MQKSEFAFVKKTKSVTQTSPHGPDKEVVPWFDGEMKLRFFFFLFSLFGVCAEDTRLGSQRHLQVRAPKADPSISLGFEGEP
jgi:hypothetical protein